MPELPEVETVRRVLCKKVLNKKISSIDVIYGNIIKNDIKFFKDNLVNDCFINILRKGKYLIFETNNNYLISHLRMEGKFFYKDKFNGYTKHDHVSINFIDGSKLIYNDVRKFGTMELISKDKIDDYFIKLGKEPKYLDIEYVRMKVCKSNKPVKTILLDQSIIAGLGNIYVNEVLYESKVSPFKLGKDLSTYDIDNVIKSSVRIIDKAIDEGGCTIRSYTSSLGVTGNYQNYLKVHMKDNEVCSICNKKIKKEKIGGRSTYYCEGCQR